MSNMKNFNELRAKMTPEQKAAVDEYFRDLKAEMAALAKDLEDSKPFVIKEAYFKFPESNPANKFTLPWEWQGIDASNSLGQYNTHQIIFGTAAGYWIPVKPDYEEEVGPLFNSKTKCAEYISNLQNNDDERNSEPDGWEAGFADNH